MQIMIDDNEANPQKLRIYAGLVMGLANALEALANGTLGAPKVEVPLEAPSPPRAAAPPPPPPPPSAPTENNVLPFPQPTPPLSEAPAHPLPSPLIPAISTPKNLPTVSAITSSSEPLEYDAAGLPWDGRIHQRGKGKKRDGSWKLQKGIDQSIVQFVVSELAAKKLPPSVAVGLGSQLQNLPPPPPPPPPAVESAPAYVPPAPPPPPAFVPEAASGSPAATAAASGNVVTFKMLLDKITEQTKAGKLDPMKITAIALKHGAPNIGALRSMSNLIPLVDEDIDLVIAGLG